jgi:Protein of unknown function (DUF2752)
VALSSNQARGLHLGFWVILVCAMLVGSLAVADFFANLPEELKPLARFFTTCTWRKLTQETCPLCGTTTALAHLVAGDIQASIAANPLAILLAQIAAAQLLYRTFRMARPKFVVVEEVAVTGSCLMLLIVGLVV